ncbi:MAG: hypothetical protein LAP40_26285 [Acidobacteriia bacterium]|nr:hypothetical protein [Terriglobia bacterium]
MPRRSLALIACLTACGALQATPSLGSVNFSGDLGLKPSEIRKALRATGSRTLLPGLPGLWKGWRLRPDYRPDAAESDAVRLRSLYYRRGYLAADVRVQSVDLAGGSAHIRLTVRSGPRYQVREVNGQPARPALAEVCRSLFDQRRTAERSGVVDFAPRLEFREVPGPAAGDPRRWADVTTSLTPGPSYRAGRIEFRGNHRFSDSTLRHMLRLDEGAPLDPLRVRQSLARLNRTGWFEPLTPADVAMNAAQGSDHADVTIALRETRPGAWSLSGPAGPMSIGGPLRFAMGSRLPAWGRGFLELSTYTASANLFLLAKPLGALVPFLPNRRFVRLVSLQRPLLPGNPWLSGFTVTPQLGWPGLLAGYGLAHARGLVRDALETERALTPDLPVAVVNDRGGGILNCQLPPTRSDRVRQFAGTATNLLFSFSPF